MAYIVTTALKKVTSLRRRLKVVQGGTSASKTISVLQYLIDKMQQREGIIITITSESMPHLKRGAMRDFMNIMRGHKFWRDGQWNATDKVYTDPHTGSIIEFVSGESVEPFIGPRRHVLYINEANNVAYGVFEQGDMRTEEEVIVDFNPVSDFWLQEKILPYQEHDFLKLTYLDNEGLPESIRTVIESRKHMKNWWRVYGLGETGVREGLVFDNFMPIDDVPLEAEFVGYGVDFGYTNDPTAIVAGYRWNGGWVFEEVDYRTGLKNRQIFNVIAGLGDLKANAVGDSSEPKSIDEIVELGLKKFHGVIKSSGSKQSFVDYSIQVMQGEKIWVTRASTNIWHEQRNHMWKVDRNGNRLNIPEGDFNHALDAMRYLIVDSLGTKKARLKSRAGI